MISFLLHAAMSTSLAADFRSACPSERCGVLFCSGSAEPVFLLAGFGVMASVVLASSAMGLACIVCLFTLLIGPITLTLYKYAAFLFLITLHTIILCQCVTPPFPSILSFCHCLKSYSGAAVLVLIMYGEAMTLPYMLSSFVVITLDFPTGGRLRRATRAAHCSSTQGSRTLCSA